MRRVRRDDDMVICSYCAGSGEGMHSDTTCYRCSGWGEVPKSLDDDGYGDYLYDQMKDRRAER
jgi:RecJ-like exonuclease